MKHPNFGVPGSKNREYCVDHAKDGMVSLSMNGCTHKGCIKGAYFGMAGSKKKVYCAEHAKNGMVDICSGKKRYCAHGSCKRIPSFGMAGTRKREYCLQHAKKGMVNISLQGCSREGCTKKAFFGMAGSKKREYCAEHAVSGMVNVNRTDCAHEGCMKEAFFGIAGSRNKEYCAQHAKDGMVNLPRRCVYDGCMTRASFGVTDSKKREHCAIHAKDGMVNINKQGDCAQGRRNNHPSLGVDESRRERQLSARNTQGGKVNVNRKKHVSVGTDTLSEAGIHKRCTAQSQEVNSCRKRVDGQNHSTEESADNPSPPVRMPKRSRSQSNYNGDSRKRTRRPDTSLMASATVNRESAAEETTPTNDDHEPSVTQEPSVKTEMMLLSM